MIKNLNDDELREVHGGSWNAPRTLVDPVGPLIYSVNTWRLLVPPKPSDPDPVLQSQGDPAAVGDGVAGEPWETGPGDFDSDVGMPDGN